MNPPIQRSDWQLPTGVPQGSWQYSQARYIAEDYDAFFAEHGLLNLDADIVHRHLHRPGIVVDLGCGTGRALLPLIAKGFTGIGVDLSQAMLRVLQRKAHELQLPMHALRGNMVEMNFLADASCDYAICLFSTLGMIEGAENRAKAMAHICRILKPGGLLVLHVHNYWHNLLHYPSRGWLIRDYFQHWLRPEDRGDTRNDYRGIRNFFLHLFTHRELQQLIVDAGLQPREWTRIGRTGDRPLHHAWFARGLRTQGWVVVCEKPS